MTLPEKKVYSYRFAGQHEHCLRHLRLHKSHDAYLLKVQDAYLTDPRLCASITVQAHPSSSSSRLRTMVE